MPTAPERSELGGAPRTVARGSHRYDPYADANVLVDAAEDRWRWRRKIKANPVQRSLYRAAVAVVGLALVVLGLVTGPIPGPGGIPLVLLGLAVWSSEFEWAHRVMRSFKRQLRRFQSWSRLQQTGFWIAFFAGCGLCGYASMVALGVPSWVPASADLLLERLPGL